MQYNITVRKGNKAFPYRKLHYTFTQYEFYKLKKDVVKTNYDGSFVMTNGDIVEVEELV